jgi:hypothetical protein
MWKKIDNQTSKTCIFMKLSISVPDCTIDQMQKCFTIDVRKGWEDNAEFKKIGDVPDGQLVYIVGPKPKMPFIDQRDFIAKLYHRDAWFHNDDGTTAAHVSARVGGEHADYPAKSGMTRGEEYLLG